jgi:hypothetical protein
MTNTRFGSKIKLSFADMGDLLSLVLKIKTLTGKQNHYNVKLRGYGISIDLKNNQLVLKNGQLYQVMQVLRNVINFPLIFVKKSRNRFT